MLKLVVGLGNPGSKYEKTRHNAGFVFLDELASRCGSVWSVDLRFQGLISECVVGGQKLILLKPQTFMNLSGASVGSLMRYYKLQVNELLVVHDELDLPEGVIKLKRDGGHAGHNGLRDIISRMAAKDFYRLRIGVGRPSPGMDIAEYVLTRASLAVYDAMLEEIHFVCNEFSNLIHGDVAGFNACLAERNKKKK